MNRKLPLFTLVVLLLATVSWAQIRPHIGLPISMTLTLEKPAPDKTYGDQRTIQLGVGGQTYQFVLHDLFVADPEGRITSADIWEQVRQSRPNIQVQGLDNDAIAKIRPGETMTIDGIYAPITRTFEVAEVRPGPGITGSPKQY